MLLPLSVKFKATKRVVAEEDFFCSVDLHFRNMRKFITGNNPGILATVGLCGCNGSISGSCMCGCLQYIKWLCLITLLHSCDLGERGLVKEPCQSILFQLLCIECMNNSWQSNRITELYCPRKVP